MSWSDLVKLIVLFLTCAICLLIKKIDFLCNKSPLIFRRIAVKVADSSHLFMEIKLVVLSPYLALIFRSLGLFSHFLLITTSLSTSCVSLSGFCRWLSFWQSGGVSIRWKKNKKDWLFSLFVKMPIVFTWSNWLYTL